jgi:hypothetical protein
MVCIIFMGKKSMAKFTTDRYGYLSLCIWPLTLCIRRITEMFLLENEVIMARRLLYKWPSIIVVQSVFMTQVY